MKRALLAWLFCLATGAAHAQSTAEPLMLVASPALQGPYNHTALIAMPAGDGHIGFVVNRASDLKLGALFPQHAPSAKVVDPVYLGGPEMSNAIFALVPRNPGVDAMPLFGGTYLVADVGAVDQVIEQMPTDARFFAGFVGWRPGELAQEIAVGYWYVTEPDAADVFRRDTSTLWEELLERVSGLRRSASL